MKTKLLPIIILLQTTVCVFAQSINVPQMADKLYAIKCLNAKSALTNLGFRNIKKEKRDNVYGSDKTFTVISCYYNNLTTKCEIYYLDEKKLPDMVSLSVTEYPNLGRYKNDYDNADYQITDCQIKPAYMNKEGMDRWIIKWEKKSTPKSYYCISELAHVYENEENLIDLGTFFYKK